MVCFSISISSISIFSISSQFTVSSLGEIYDKLVTFNIADALDPLLAQPREVVILEPAELLLDLHLPEASRRRRARRPHRRSRACAATVHNECVEVDQPPVTRGQEASLPVACGTPRQWYH